MKERVEKLRNVVLFLTWWIYAHNFVTKDAPSLCHALKQVLFDFCGRSRQEKAQC